MGNNPFADSTLSPSTSSPDSLPANSFKLKLNFMSDWTQEEYESHLGLYWDDDWYGQDLLEVDTSQSMVKDSLSTLKKLIKSIKDYDMKG